MLRHLKSCVSSNLPKLANKGKFRPFLNSNILKRYKGFLKPDSDNLEQIYDPIKKAPKAESPLKDKAFQNFVMMINQMLTKEEIHKFIQLVDQFVRKVDNYRATQREVFVENFYEKILIFLHKHNCSDLYKYFLKVDIEKFSSRNFYEILGVDLEKDAEYLHDSNKFVNYVGSVIPIESPAIKKKDNMVKIISSQDKNLEDTDEFMLEEVSKIDMSRKNDNLPKNSNESNFDQDFSDKDSKNENEVQDSTNQKFIDDLGIDSNIELPKNVNINSQDKHEIQNEKILRDDSDNFGFDISSQGFSFENSTNSLLPDYTAPRSVTNYYSKKMLARDEEEILQKRDEVVILNQAKEQAIEQDYENWSNNENMIDRIDENLNVNTTKITDWLYVFGLPYEIPQIADTKIEIDNALSRISGYQTISEVQIYQYKDFIDINESKMAIEVPEGFEKYFDPIALKRSRMLEKTGQSYELEGSNEFAMPFIKDNAPISMMYNKEEQQRMKRNETIKTQKKLFNNSENIIGSIEEGRRKKLDKSYALVKLESYESKQKLIRPDLRAFGILINGNLCKVEDADHKISLSLYNLPYGISVKEVCEFQNEKIERKIHAIKNDLEENQTNIEFIPNTITFETNRNDMRKLLIKFSLVLRLENLETAIFQMDNLNGLEFHDRPIKLNLMFGSLKTFGEVFYETVDNETNKVLMNRINIIKNEKFSQTNNQDSNSSGSNMLNHRVTNYSKLKDRIIKKELEENYGSVDNFIESNWIPQDETNFGEGDSNAGVLDNGLETLDENDFSNLLQEKHVN